MNIKAVLRTYGMLRSLTDDESALLETLRRFTDTEREAFVEALGPQKVAKKSTGKRSSKSPAVGKLPRCANCNAWEINPIHDRTANHPDYHAFIAKSAGKSARASGMAAALNKSLQQQRQVTAIDDNEDDSRCTYKLGEDGGSLLICDALPDNNVHHKTTDPDYHQFQPATNAAHAGAGE
jgi:hypothetical protein